MSETPTGPASVPPGNVRASDADRERVAALLHTALGEGRLTLGEVDERLAQVYSARTHADLAPITADLPGANIALAQPTSPLTAPSGLSRVIDGPEAGRATAVFGGVERKGRWAMPRFLRLTTIFGGADLDFTSATLSGPTVRVKVCAIFGGAQLTVPPDVTVHLNVAAVFGGADNKANDSAGPGAPTIEISGLVLFGGLAIVRPKSPRAVGRR